MKKWAEQLENEKEKLDPLGNESLANGIRLYENNALQAQSRKVDELIVQLYRRIGFEQRSTWIRKVAS
ncbi:aspartyl-phosphate phosphatase Spo0E family protein [Paenibacillus sp. J2TS4]|uniref:aspartyl-phosphate phosphatase Spo0E family protein n=1 Tax=Paenibacillus sp. J2TS4 TaxID=2807194 RepID=UPI001B24A788|nr:aspartyl-phosphate phosphatase Spo0E family protein [Paenibacillus sp. J2TS4]GIP33522.1 hypothetical protein J2TS4_27320 [Paenibacillus sp. J2TS4]